jgi:hypothetical protein
VSFLRLGALFVCLLQCSQEFILLPLELSTRELSISLLPHQLQPGFLYVHCFLKQARKKLCLKDTKTLDIVALSPSTGGQLQPPQPRALQQPAQKQDQSG